MAPVNSSISNNVSLSPVAALITRKSNFLSSCTIPRKLNAQTFPYQKHSLPLSTSIRLFPQFGTTCVLKPKLVTRTLVSTSGIDVDVEEADLSPADNQTSVTATDATDISGESSIKSEISPVKSKPSRIKKSLMPPVKIEELIPGATFKGKVVSVQPFGAFVDFGAFTDGLVHVSRLCHGFVKDVGHVVTVGQEVTIGIIEANMETGRISLSMRENDDPAKAVQQQRDGSVSSDTSIPPRVKRSVMPPVEIEELIPGATFKGKVVSIHPFGAFVDIGAFTDGLVHVSCLADGFVKDVGDFVTVGQEVTVRLTEANMETRRISLSMRESDDPAKAAQQQNFVKGIEVDVEEADLSPADNQTSVTVTDATDISGESSIKSEISPVKSKHSRIKKSSMPPVKIEELIPGATFKGKVVSTHPFGAFVDFGAFTDGLVHVSNLYDGFVKDVGDFVTVGQEVTVRLTEANMETRRISLSMRESDDPAKAAQQQRDGPFSTDKSGPPRKYNQRNFVKGQNLEGTVKNLTRSGAFISLPEGEEGFLPSSEEPVEGFANMMGGTSLEVGQKVSVRVLRITRGKVTLTMKKEEDLSELDAKLNQGVVHKATNPFALAFQRNSVMSAFLDKRKKENEATLYAVGSGMDDVTSLDALDREENAENNEEAELSGKVSDLSSEIVEKAEEDAVEDAILNDEEQTKEPRNGVPSDVQSASELFGNPPSLIDATETDGEPLVSGELTDQTSSHTVGDAILNDEEQTTEPRNGVPSDVQSASELFGNPLSLIDTTETDGEPLVSGELTDQTSSHTVEQVTTEASDNVIGKDDEA